MAESCGPVTRSRVKSSSSNSSNACSTSSSGGSSSSGCGGNVPTGTAFYQWAVSPVCDRICQRLPRWVHPDLVSFLGLACAAAAAFCCCTPHAPDSTTRLAASAFFWILYALLDNLDGKQARRLGLCSAGGDFFDHSSDSISSSFAALIILHMLCGRVSTAAESAAAGQQQACVSLAFLRHIPLLRALLPGGGSGFRVCFQAISQLDIHPSLFQLSFIVLAQLPFFTATWAHPIVGRTMLSADLDGPGTFSVDELNFLVIPGLLLLRALYPTFFVLSVFEGLEMLPFVGGWLSATAAAAAQRCSSFFVPQPQQQQVMLLLQQQLSIGFCVLLVSDAFCIYQSSRLLISLMSREHLPRFVPGLCFFAAVSDRRTRV
ncbi:CDP-alcohol phosphatidyltransferase domain-containing protein, putative [Eimeria mitis]|uniref:CDP-alcohol phosphatidyltransferase domain-containing protein, putative n=1 Tax=Eimeria mitis TaxID=44415 RepID=U6K5L0_9EIME|nr:CDP-alcohol phosphatidyltransferase domain-containing protein, putative [Eimeria mitis]CDJ33155.1 CDP-alcohol phosphatidyltransferase domain-containing protein, putative [Eimeria mitis]